MTIAVFLPIFKNVPFLIKLFDYTLYHINLVLDLLIQLPFHPVYKFLCKREKCPQKDVHIVK